MSTPVIQARIIVSGVVQGVGYRYFTLSLARRYPITGWVRNLPDGRVEVVAEGEQGLINDFISDLRIGPSSGNVAGVEVEWKAYTGDFENFSLKF